MARLLTLLIAVVATGCRTATPPRPQTFVLAGSEGTYRAYGSSAGNICDAEPRWLSEELSSLNRLLSNYLAQTIGSVDDEWPEDKRQLLREGAKSLPEVTQIHAANLKQMERCSFPPTARLEQVQERGNSLVTAVQERLAESGVILAFLDARDARAKWLSDRPKEEARAKESCESDSKEEKNPLYFAWQDVDGKIRYLFCDEAMVLSDTNGATDFRAPPHLSRKQLKRLKQDPYLEAVFSLAPEDIRRPPPEPKRPGQSEPATQEATETP